MNRYLEYYCLFWKRALTFKGRTSAGEFIVGWLTNLVLLAAINGLENRVIWYMTYAAFNQLYLIIAVLLLTPMVTAAVRRLHDGNYSPAWAMLLLLPLINLVALIWLTWLPGTPGPNRFGPPPPTSCEPE